MFRMIQGYEDPPEDEEEENNEKEHKSQRNKRQYHCMDNLTDAAEDAEHEQELTRAREYVGSKQQPDPGVQLAWCLLQHGHQQHEGKRTYQYGSEMIEITPDEVYEALNLSLAPK
mmetsp:Transcript_57121/g.102235  ORF Transcript_57121/g.102235 Transcript_57121/m.102235 type:complete len:115 (+) Transcript_57121:887-1231(+)